MGLDSKLSGWGQNQDDRTVTWSEQWLSVDVDHGGQGKRDGLSGTGLGDSDDISSRQGHRPSLALDRGGSVETHGSDLGHDVFGETGLVKGGNGSGDVVSLDLKNQFEPNPIVQLVTYLHGLGVSESLDLGL